jgi:hypothetical protein
MRRATLLAAVAASSVEARGMRDHEACQEPVATVPSATASTAPSVILRTAQARPVPAATNRLRNSTF